VNVAGLATGETLVLQNNAGDNLSVTSNGMKSFAPPVRSGLPYAVTLLSQPVFPAAQTCTVTGPAGTVMSGPVTLAVTCMTNTYSVGGTVSGLTGTGLVLRDNGGDDRSVSADGTFTFATPVASGSTHNITGQKQTPSPRARTRGS